MGKLCSVKSCPSGRKLKSKGIDTSQPLSFFRPTTPAKLKKWNMALGTTMKTTDYICHLHFKEEDIKMYDTFNIKGEITILPTCKKTLRDEALPTIEHQFISVPAYEFLTRLVNKSQKVHSNHNQSENKMDDQDQSKQQGLFNRGVTNNLIHIIQQNEHDLDIPQLNKKTHDDIQNDKESDVISQSAETFLENLKSSLLPQGWMYFEKPEGLEFVRINLTTMQILNHLRVNKDLSITAILSNEELNVNDNISSFNSINDYLKSVERWPICVGTQMYNNKFSKLCKGVLVGDDSYKRNQANPRCKSCRILRHRLQNYKSTSTVLESSIAEKRRASNLQKRCKRPKRMQHDSTTNVSNDLETSNSNTGYEINKAEEIISPSTSIIVEVYKEVNDNDKENRAFLNLSRRNSDVSVASTVPENIETKQLNDFPIKSVTHEYSCEICSQRFEFFFDYQDHQETHNGQFVFWCSKCDEVFSSRNEIVQHEKNHKVSCVICRTEVLPKSLEAHMIKHTDIYKCSTCGSTHSSRAALENHFKARHAGVKGYICHMCGKQNSCQASMNRHLATHLLIRPFKCKLCNFTTKSKTNLSVHISRKHSNEKCYCETCGKLCNSKFTLKQHKRRIHAPKRFVCKQCGKHFSEKYNWNRHVMKKHSKERVSECKLCRQEFFTTKNLKNHMHVHRTGCVRCFKCGKVFIYKKYLEKHMLKCQNVNIQT